MIVEDDLSLQKLYEFIFRRNGINILGIADNGEKAVEMFEKFNEKPKIILMDHRMPQKDGIETTKEIIKMSKASKIIFASAEHNIKQEALSIGAYSFLEKPFPVQALINEIRKINDINLNK